MSELEVEIFKKAMRLLTELTPLGSEFYNNPERCYEYIKERLHFGHEAKKELVLLKRNNYIISKTDDPSKWVEWSCCPELDDTLIDDDIILKWREPQGGK